MNVEKTAYVEPRKVNQKEFPVLKERFTKVKEKLKEYEKQTKNSGRGGTKKKISGGKTASGINDEKNKLKALIENIQELDKVLLLRTESEVFLRKDYREIVGRLDLPKSNSRSTWWDEPGNEPKELLQISKVNEYSNHVTRIIDRQKSYDLPSSIKEILQNLSERVLKLLHIVDETLIKADKVMDRFASLSMKTRILGRKTFYGEGYQEMKNSYSMVSALKNTMHDLLSEIQLLLNGRLNVLDAGPELESQASGRLLDLANNVSEYNTKTSALHSKMKMRHKMTESEFQNEIKATVRLLEDLVEKTKDLDASAVEFDKKAWAKHCLQLANKVKAAEGCQKTLAEIATYYDDLEKQLKSCAMGRVLLLKDRYGHYLEAIQQLCDSIAKIFK